MTSPQQHYNPRHFSPQEPSAQNRQILNQKQSMPDRGRQTDDTKTENQQIVWRLKQQLKNFRTQLPQRSLPAVLADQLILEGNQISSQAAEAENCTSSQWLDSQADLWNDVSQIGDDWDEQNAIALDDSSLDKIVTANSNVESNHEAPGPAGEVAPNVADENAADEYMVDGQSDDRELYATEALTVSDSTVSKTIFSTDCPALDQWFPDQGIPAGNIIEVVSSQIGGGATHFCLHLAKAICGEQGLLVVIDRRHDFHAAALVSLGFDLQNVLLVRPDCDEDHLWALEQSLSHSSVAAVWTRIEMLDNRYQRRWQLAVEKSQAIGILQRPESVLTFPTWAFAQMKLSPNPHSSLLTSNQSYYQNHSKFRPFAAERFPFQENWIVDLQAIKIRGRFEQPTLRLELQNQVAMLDSTNSQALPMLTQRLVHPNDPTVTKTFERFDRNLHEVASDETCRSTSFRNPSPDLSEHKTKQHPTENRLCLDSRLAHPTSPRRTSSA